MRKQPRQEVYIDHLQVTKRLEEERRLRHEQHTKELQQHADKAIAEMLANDSEISEDGSSFYDNNSAHDEQETKNMSGEIIQKSPKVTKIEIAP